MRGYVTINQEVDIDDVLAGLSTKEKQELVDELFEDGFKAKKNDRSLLDDDFDIQVSKLIGNKHKITSEDEATVLLIANKIIL